MSPELHGFGAGTDAQESANDVGGGYDYRYGDGDGFGDGDGDGIGSGTGAGYGYGYGRGNRGYDGTCPEGEVTA